MAEPVYQPHGEDLVRIWNDFCIIYYGGNYRPEITEDEILSIQQSLEEHSYSKFWGKVLGTDIEALFLVFRDHVIIKPVLLGNLGRTTYEIIECYPYVNDIVVQ